MSLALDTQFSDDYFISSGIYLIFTATGSQTNLLAGWKIRDVNKSVIAIDQEEVSHQLAGEAAKRFISLLADPGDVTCTAYFEPKKAQPTPATFRTLKKGQDGTLTLAFVDYPDGATVGSAYAFFRSAANLQEYGDLSAPIGKPATASFKFKLSGVPLYGTDANTAANSGSSPSGSSTPG